MFRGLMTVLILCVVSLPMPVAGESSTVAATPEMARNKCSDFSSPAGDFAETFAVLQVGDEYFSGRIAPRPTDKDVPALIKFFSFLPKTAFPAPKDRV